MKMANSGLPTRRALFGLGGALALLTLAASATFAAGLPAFAGPADQSLRPSESAVASDNDNASPTVKPSDDASAKDGDNESAKPSENPSAGAEKTGALVGPCHALNGQAAEVIGRLIQTRIDLTKHHKADSSAAPVIPPGLQKVYNRLQACASNQPEAGSSENPSQAAPSLPIPSIIPGSDRSMPAPANGHGRGHGNGH